MEPTVDFRVTCPICQETAVVKVKQSEYDAWKDGMLIGDAMPSVTKDDRERLMTGLCPKDWDVIMTANEDELYR